MRFILPLGLTVLLSCNSYYSGGYYITDKDNRSYYGNERRHLYIQLSDKFLYREDTFNVKELRSSDVQLLCEFNLKPRSILFSYHSMDRESITLLKSKSKINLSEWKIMRAVDGANIYYQSFVKKGYVYRKNLYPYKNRYIMVLEKTAVPSKLNQIKPTRTLIFPKILSKKPKL